ncbi:sensor domain-containing protein [Haloglomus litoreum]|uniref:sensor domain-containing protein n=1 Tax=Haloglomus litoreum TaxID=3034026 RepID=UPI0023E78BAF|nr:sensor domain-containing protein [Haloglomus sp. DT116]
MSDTVARLRSSVPRPSLWSVATAPFRPRTYGNLLYLALAFPLGIAYVVFLGVGLGLSVGLAVLLVGVPLFVGVLLATVALVTVERRLATTLLGVDLDPPDWRFRDREGAVDRATALVVDPAVWLGLLFLATRLAVGIGGFVLLMVLLVPSLVLVATPLYYDTPGVRVGIFLPTDVTRELSLYVPWNELLVGVSFVVRLTSWQVTSLGGALAMSVLGLLALGLSLNVLNGVAWLCGRWARLVLGRSLVDRVG